MKRKSVKAISLLLILALSCGQTSMGAQAAEQKKITTVGSKKSDGKASANPMASAKEEVVYSNLTAEGKVEGIYVVNSFQGVKGKTIVDYGSYTQVINLTTSEEIRQNKDEITLVTQADKVYYQGNLSTKNLPWKIEIGYEVDGKGYKPSEVGGKSGHLKMEIDISQNPAVDDSFWESYALQISFMLDGDTCKNITAKDATIANVGSSKQLSYICLPGKEAKLLVEADVTDFGLGEISINGTRLNLDMEVDSGKINDQLKEVQNAVAEVDDGAKELQKGAGELTDGVKDAYDGSMDLQEGTNSLKEGTGSLQQGAAQLQQGAGQLQQGIGELQQGANTLNQRSGELSSAAAQLASGLESLQTGIDTYQNALQQQLSQAGVGDINGLLASHDALLGALGISNTQRALYEAYASRGDQGAMQKLQELAYAQDGEAMALLGEYQRTQDPLVITEYITQAGTLIAVETLVSADRVYIEGSSSAINQIAQAAPALVEGSRQLSSGIASYTGGVSDLAAGASGLKEGIDSLKEGIDSLKEGSDSLYSGAESLQEGSRTLTEGMANLYDGSASLQAGTNELKKGTGEFYEETRDIDGKVQDSIDETMKEMLGKDVPVKSFVSEKNTNVESVLFVMKTAPVEAPVQEGEIAPTVQELSWWEKFKALFR
ncbi:MAG: hypothetical protein ACI4DN_11385 [Lachnospiraceae bacterium]